MNKTVLAHLKHLSQKADKTYKPSVAGYKPVSPFKTNKMVKIVENTTPSMGFKLSDILSRKNRYENI